MIKKIGMKQKNKLQKIPNKVLEKMIKDLRYTLADLMREKIRRKGYELVDTKDKTIIKKIK